MKSNAKSKADEIIRARWGIQVEHICAQRKKMDGSGEMEKVTYETLFYHVPNRKGRERERERRHRTIVPSDIPKGQSGAFSASCVYARPTSNKIPSNACWGWPLTINSYCKQLKTQYVRIPLRNRGLVPPPQEGGLSASFPPSAPRKAPR